MIPFYFVASRRVGRNPEQEGLATTYGLFIEGVSRYVMRNHPPSPYYHTSTCIHTYTREGAV